MKAFLRAMLPFLLTISCSGQQLRVIAARNCNGRVAVEVRFSNMLSSSAISTSLSSDYQSGHTLHAAHIEFFDPTLKQWKITEPGTDSHPAGTRILEPHIAVNDLVSGGFERLTARDVDNVKFRVRVLYQIEGKKPYRTAFSVPFTLAELKGERFTSEPWIVQELSRWCR